MSTRSINRDPFEQFDYDFLDADPAKPLNSDNIRLVRLPLEQLRPDPAQPRRVLSSDIHKKFHSKEYTPYQALRAEIDRVNTIAAEHRRLFRNPAELVKDEDEGTEHPLDDLTPEEASLRELVLLAQTLRNDGQVNPITVVDISSGKMPQFLIETGERRYWAGYMMRDFLPDPPDSVHVHCLVIAREKASAFRQARENAMRNNLNAIGLSRQAARLLFEIYGVQLPDGPITNEFFRQALELDLKSSVGRARSDEVYEAMGVKRSQFSKLKKLLSLSDRVIEYGDRKNLSEKILSLFLHFPVEDQDWYVELAETHRWTPQKLEAQLREDTLPRQASEVRQTSALARHIRRDYSITAEELGDELLELEGDVHMACARLQRRIDLFELVKDYLKAK